MARINSIQGTFTPGACPGPAPDGDVYFGLCGSEFFIHTTRDDFERGAARE
jgi:hypothetical protein